MWALKHHGEPLADWLGLDRGRFKRTNNLIKNLEFDSIHKDKTMDDKHTESFVQSNSELKNL